MKAIKSNWPSVDQLIIVGPLTDKKIVRYALAGYYGEDVRRRFESPRQKARRKLAAELAALPLE